MRRIWHVSLHRRVVVSQMTFIAMLLGCSRKIGVTRIELRAAGSDLTSRPSISDRCVRYLVTCEMR